MTTIAPAPSRTGEKDDPEQLETSAPLNTTSTLGPATLDVTLTLEPPTTEPISVTQTKRGSDRLLAKTLFKELVSLPDTDPKRHKIRQQLVEMHLMLAEFFARKFINRGENIEDLIQVARIGLIKSVDRFDPDRGVEFSTFAAPTILGEIKRHFRDKGWAVRVPRRLQELRLAISKAVTQLYQDLGHSPTVAELATYLNLSEEIILEGLESAQAYTASSLDSPGENGDSPSLGEHLGGADPGINQVDLRESLKPLLAELPEREKSILMMRFFEELTQSQIAIELGLSQMHVSRILNKTLSQLRAGLFQEQ